MVGQIFLYLLFLLDNRNCFKFVNFLKEGLADDSDDDDDEINNSTCNNSHRFYLVSVHYVLVTFQVLTHLMLTILMR